MFGQRIISLEWHVRQLNTNLFGNFYWRNINDVYEIYVAEAGR